MTTSFCFPLSWHVSGSELQIFGWSNVKNTDQSYKSLCVRVTGFHPYMYIRLPKHIHWNTQKVQNVIDAIKKYPKMYISTIQYCKLRGNYSNIHEPLSSYLFVSFINDSARKAAVYALKRPIAIPALGSIVVQCFEATAAPYLQLICKRAISTANWIQMQNPQQQIEDKISTCAEEYKINWKSLFPATATMGLPSPLIMGYDIETYAHRSDIFCDPKHPEDVIFQISLVFARQGSATNTWTKIILSLGNPSYAGEDVQVICCKSEKYLLLEYIRCVNEYQPDILIGYNTFGFDNKYMYERAVYHQICDEFVRHGATCERANLYDKSWSSSAYSNQKIVYIDIKGRVHIDLMILIRRDYNLPSYKLSEVSNHFLKRTKDPLTYIDIHNTYKHHLSGADAEQELNMVARYCVKDSVLVVELFEYLKYWYSLTAMAKICYVPLNYLFQRGQQIKVYSQVYNYCYQHSIVVEDNSYEPKPDHMVQGAYVLEPNVGFHKNVVSFDFASLYPSIMVSHNISYDTLVKPDQKLDETQYHTIEWEEHFGCDCEGAEPKKKIKDKIFTACSHRNFKWLKEPRGVLPSIVEGLLDARKQVRQQMKQMKKGTIDYDIADKLQVAYKLSANSAYGGLASMVGPLVFTVGGMCVTAVGRRSLLTIKDLIQTEHSGVVVYGDTDSGYVYFQHVPIEQLDEFCFKVAAQISAHFPPPMKLAYEEKIYERIFFFSKKRYAYFVRGSDTLEYKGILLKRRDSTQLIKDAYQRLILLIMNEASRPEIEAAFYEELIILLSGCAPLEKYMITSSLKDIDNLNLSEKNDTKMKMGEYTVTRLSEDETKRQTQMKKKGVQSEGAYYISCLPRHVQVALKMRARGQTIQSGSRLGMIYSKQGGPQASQRLEEIEYFEAMFTRKHIDTLQYVNLFLNPIMELFAAHYKEPNKPVFKQISKSCVHKAAVIQQLNELFDRLIFFDTHKNITDYFK